MKAGGVMSIAAMLHVRLNRESIECNPAQHTADTVRPRRIHHSTQINQQKLIEQSSQLEESWEQAQDRCRTAIQMCETNRCPVWLNEKHTTAKTPTKHARALIQKIEGSILKGTEQPVLVRVVHQVSSFEATTRQAKRDHGLSIGWSETITTVSLHNRELPNRHLKLLNK